MSQAISIVETLQNLGVNCECLEPSDEEIGCDEWRQLLPHIRNQILCLIGSISTVSNFDGIEVRNPREGAKTLMEIARFIEEMCVENNKGLIHVRVTTESCGDPCYRWNP